MTYGLNAYSGARLTLTSQLPLSSFLGSYEHPIGPVSRSVETDTPPTVFVRCTNNEVAWSVPRIQKGSGNSWTITFAPLPYLLRTTGQALSAGVVGTFQVLIFGSNPAVNKTGYGSILNTASLSAGPMSIDGHVRLDLNAADKAGLPVTSSSGRSVFFPGADEMVICSHIGRNSYNSEYQAIALETAHPAAGVPLGFGIRGNVVTSFQGYRDSAVQPRQYEGYWDIILLNPNKYV